MSHEEVRITLRLPAELRDQLQRSAEEKERSMNGEIVARLDWTLKFDPDSFDKFILKHEDLARRHSDLLKEHSVLEAHRERLMEDLLEAKTMATELRFDRKRLSDLEVQVKILSAENDRLRDRYTSSQKAANRGHEVIRNLVNLLVRRLGVDEAEIEEIQNLSSEED